MTFPSLLGAARVLLLSPTATSLPVDQLSFTKPTSPDGGLTPLPSSNMIYRRKMANRSQEGPHFQLGTEYTNFLSV
ncbi:hypothetical protein GGS23DRAFT_23682 [Durotheca rogersii]|uniref:uncharacterized protein n=1 Tax=Durotheca rogersii TaxID=419775 RepID=UPI00222025FF|nr:uncharacterized protein GGS23DRAFT_23682 [Durotheca rogersii]KAI5868338.1 hypothetical protein GGS23DRAFT_23682 [Durotheca rogersii]